MELTVAPLLLHFWYDTLLLMALKCLAGARLMKLMHDLSPVPSGLGQPLADLGLPSVAPLEFPTLLRQYLRR